MYILSFFLKLQNLTVQWYFLILGPLGYQPFSTIFWLFTVILLFFMFWSVCSDFQLNFHQHFIIFLQALKVATRWRYSLGRICSFSQIMCHIRLNIFLWWRSAIFSWFLFPFWYAGLSRNMSMYHTNISSNTNQFQRV